MTFCDYIICNIWRFLTAKIDSGGVCNQLLLCALHTIWTHAPRHERPSEPSHFPLALQMPLSLPINLNPVLHSYSAMLLYVVIPLTRVTVPLGWNVGGPQSTTAIGREGKKGGGAVVLTSHKCTGVEEVDHSLWQVGVVPLHWPLALQVRLDGPLIGYPTSHEYVALSPKRVPSLVSTRPLLGATRGPQETPAKNIDTAHNTLCRIRSMYECIWDVLCW